MKRKIFFMAILICATTHYAFSAEPDFTGTWVLDTEKSTMGSGRSGAGKLPMQKVTVVIKQTGTTLSIERKTADRTETAVFKLDGTETVNKLPSGNDIKSTSDWVGSTLVTKSTMVLEGTTVQATDVRSLSPDGKVMTIQVTSQTPNGEAKSTVVYNKQ